MCSSEIIVNQNQNKINTVLIAEKDTVTKKYIDINENGYFDVELIFSLKNVKDSGNDILINKPVSFSIGDVSTYNLIVFYDDGDNETSFEVYKANTTIDADNLVVTAYVGKDLVITLKDAKGNALVGKTVTFTFNGKKYTRITDEDGEATLTIKSSYTCLYPVTITFADEWC